MASAKFKIGQRVKVSNIGYHRESVVTDVRVNQCGTTIYVLADGGWVGESELGSA